MSQSTQVVNERYQSSGTTTQNDQTSLESVTIPTDFKSRHHLKNIHQKILSNIKIKREEFRVMTAKDIRHANSLAETTRKAKVAVEKMTHGITLFYNKKVDDLHQSREDAYDALKEVTGHEYKIKHFLVTLRYGVGPRVWFMNQLRDKRIQQLHDAVDKLQMSCFMARLTDGGRVPNNVFAFA